MTDLPPSSPDETIDPFSFIVEYDENKFPFHFRDRPYTSAMYAFCDQLVADGKITGWFESEAVEWPREQSWVDTSDPSHYVLREKTNQIITITPSANISKGSTVLITGIETGSSLSVDGAAAVPVTDTELHVTFDDAGTYSFLFTEPKSTPTTVTIEVS